MDDHNRISKDFVQLARVALAGGEHDVLLFLRRMARRYRETMPELAASFRDLLRDAPTRVSPLREGGGNALPVDLDSRLQLMRVETTPELELEPVFTTEIEKALQLIVRERLERGALLEAGLEPTRTVLFTGPPGVGKSLAARWLARELHTPLLVLDLSAVMSSFLGRTGNNVRRVIDYAKGVPCVLLLDELDAVAKRRDDSTEVGELKRLVTVLLQEIDCWQGEGLLVAATNHANLLDPAVWRRFEMCVDFPMPGPEGLAAAIERFLGPDAERGNRWLVPLSHGLQGLSFSDAERLVVGARRAAALQGISLDDALCGLLGGRLGQLPREARAQIAMDLIRTGHVSQRAAYELTGVSRDTIRKAVRRAAPESMSQRGAI